MQQPERQWYGRGKSSPDSNAEKKRQRARQTEEKRRRRMRGMGQRERQGLGAVPGEARLRAWRLASGDDSSEAATRPIAGAGPEQRWAHESAMRKKRGTHARAAGAKHMYMVLTNADDWSNR